mgnify:CR=1
MFKKIKIDNNEQKLTILIIEKTKF